MGRVCVCYHCLELKTCWIFSRNPGMEVKDLKPSETYSWGTPSLSSKKMEHLQVVKRDE